ncbi:MAG: N4-gp56 family major capsid protein [Erysipelotrichaceae bacterium]
MAVSNVTTQLAQLIDPEVMADMISAKIPKKIVVAPFAKIDKTLVGQPGDTITVPAYGYIGDAEDIAEGDPVTAVKMSTTTKKATIKKAMKSVILTDEAVLSAYGNPVGEANNQLSLSVASKIDNDCIAALLKAKIIYDGSASTISYNAIVDAIDLFDEEVNSEKAMFINPKQVTSLRKDANFISADKYPEGVMLSGEIGKIANTRIIPTKKVVLDATSAFYTCPIIKIDEDTETEDSTPALTIYLKRDTNVETDRVSGNRTTEVSVDKFYVAALSNESKAILAKLKK